jgi:hypothetical protein
MGEWYYKIGQYRMNSQLAELLIRILYKSVETELKPYLDNILIETDIMGVADGIPVKENAVYRGEYKIENYEYFNVNSQKMQKMNLIPGRSPLTNKKIAFLRAYYALKQVQRIPSLASNTINIYVKEVDTIGERKVAMGVKFRLKDYFDDELNLFEKPIYQLLQKLN